MKNLITLIAIAAVAFACKKKTEPTPTPTPVPCATPTKLIQGKWTNNGCNHDTIKVVFYSANCDNSTEQYQCYGLNTAVQPCVNSHTLSSTYVYGFSLNEIAAHKEGFIGGYTNSFVRIENDTTLYLAMPNEGDFYFTRVH